MNVLAIETATDRGGAALLVEETGAYSATFLAPRRHGELLPGCVKAVLELGGIAPDRLDLVAVDVGPGSFTGLRIGIAFAKALAQVHGLPLVGVRQTEAVGLPVASWWPGRVVVWIHDRREFVYHAWVTAVRAGREAVLTVDEAIQKLAGKRDVFVVGTGGRAFAPRLKGVAVVGGEELAHPDPVQVARLGLRRYWSQGPEEDLQPLYLQPPLADKKEA